MFCKVNLEAKIKVMESRLGDSTATTKEKEVAISDINQVWNKNFTQGRLITHFWVVYECTDFIQGMYSESNLRSLS